MSCNEKVSTKSDQNNRKSKIQTKPVIKLSSDFYKAIFVPNSDKFIGSSINDKGLKIYDAKQETVVDLNDKNGAGINPIITKDGKKLVFQSYEFKNRRRYSSIYIQDISNKQLTLVSLDKRSLKLIGVENNNVIYLENGKVKSFDLTSNTHSDNPTNINVVFTDDNLNLCLHKNGKNTVLNPSGEGNYIWVSKSHNENFIVLFVILKAKYWQI